MGNVTLTKKMMGEPPREHERSKYELTKGIVYFIKEGNKIQVRVKTS